MKAYRCLVAALVVVTVSQTAMAQAPSTRSHFVHSRDATSRQELVDHIVARWTSYVEDMHLTNANEWVRGMTPTFERASTEALRKAATATRFKAMNDALLTGEAGREILSRQLADLQRGGTPVTKALGDADRDLVFVPITPCRIVDTRNAGGPILAGTVRNFDVTGTSTYVAQGGSATNCNGAGAAGSFAAGVFNFTVVTPASPGYITAFPFGVTQPLASTVNYVAGDIVANLGIIKLDQSAAADELSVFTLADTHLVVDLVGYFRNVSLPAGLECTTTAANTVSVSANGGTANASAPSCAAGYAETATYCESDTWLMPFVYSSNGVCSARNNDVVAKVLSAKRRCCRIPLLN